MLALYGGIAIATALGKNMFGATTTTTSPMQRLIGTDVSPDDEPTPGSLSQLEIDGLVDTRPFAIALARLCKWQSWLQVGGELVLRTTNPWATDGIQLLLTSLGFVVRRSTSTNNDDDHETTIVAVLESAPTPTEARSVVRSVLARTYDGPCFERAWNAAEDEFHRAFTRNESGISLKHPTGSTHPRGPNTSLVALPPATFDVSSAAPPAELEETAPIVSIIMLTFNALADTKLCLASLEAHTTVAYELVLVDNASSDGTSAFLREWAANRPHVRLVLNDSNTGFAGGNNIGMAIARGRYFMLLNNDTVVTSGWLERLLAVCERDPSVALVGPRSNNVSGAQKVHHAPYQTLAQLQGFAQQWTREHTGEDEMAIRLVGFCLLVTRELVEAIGGLDERFGRGNFEDDDFCLRATARGFGARIAHDVFIHHAGSKSFQAANIDYQQALQTNWRIFKAKWGISSARTLEEGYPSTLSPPEQAMDFINLPDINLTHETNEDERFFESTLNEPAPAEQAGFATSRPRTEIAALFDKAEAAAQQGDWELAAQLFEKLVRQAPTFGPGYVALASAAFATGQVQAGVLALEHACTIYPENAALRTQLGVALAHTGSLDRAQQEFLAVLDIDDENIDAIVSLAHLCRAGRHFVEAVDLLGHAGRIAPESPVVLGAIGATAIELGDKMGAEAALAHLRAVAPEHAETTQLAASLAGTAA